jgi:hypothetical protein
MKNLKGVELNRTIGIEIEGYTRDYPKMESEGVRHSQLKRDASLSNSYGYHVNRAKGVSVGMEVVSVPFMKLDMMDDIFEDIQNASWHIGRNKAGTHIHVDARDYSMTDKIKMAIFMQKLEEVMFLMVKPYRYYSRGGNGNERNRYCTSIDKNWEGLIQRYEELDIDPNRHEYVNDLIYDMAETHRRRHGRAHPSRFPSHNRYNFVNVFNTGLSTIEFRLFHAIRTPKDGKQFALLAYHIIETVKHSTLEQLNFIADSINACSTADEMVRKFTQSIGLDIKYKIQNLRLRDNINVRKTREVAV